MAVRDLLVPTVFCDGIGSDLAVLEYALGLAAHHGASLHLLTITVPPDYGSAGLPSDGRSACELQRIVERADRYRVDALRLAADAAVRLRTSAVTLSLADMTGQVVRMSRCHDLTVLQADHHAVGVHRGLIESLLLASGRPVLAAPRSATWRLQQAMVAWDGSSGAARALHDAMPLLAHAARTTVVCLDETMPGRRPISVEHLATHFESHRIIAEFRMGRIDGLLDATTFIDFTGPEAADLLVMGSHGRLQSRECVPGRLARGMLDACRFPLLLSR